MIRLIRLLALALVAAATALAADTAPAAPAPTDVSIPATESEVKPGVKRAEVERVASPDGRKARVFVIPIRQEINQSALFILRRGLKDAITWQADLVLLDMDTPGGALDVTLEMMKLLDRFEGRTATFVDENGLSAGAFISAATRDIYFAPTAVVGAAAPVQSGGQEIAASMRQKLMSFLKARVKAITSGEENRYRTEVILAMMDADSVLTVDGKELKAKGELLTLTAEEATQLYGDPAQPLFASGTAETIDGLLTKKYGEDAWERKDFEVSWSVGLARFLTSSVVTSLLLGAGVLCLYLEFKAPGLGVLGVLGACCLAVVFFGHHVAGLSGHEAILLFGLGLLLLAVEVFVFPGTLVAGIAGILCVLASLVLGMADLWPQTDGTGIVFEPDALLRPLGLLGTGLFLSGCAAAVLWQFLPRTAYWKQMVLETPAAPVVAPVDNGGQIAVGAVGVAITDLRPGGQVRFGERVREATVVDGVARAGDRVRVVGRLAFEVRVEVIDPARNP